MRYSETETIDIILSPEELADIPLSVRNHISRFKHACSDKGYIMDIVDIVSYTNCVIRASGSCLFRVTCVFDLFVPHVNEIYEPTVDLIFSEGIFGVMPGMKLLVPSTRLSEGWVFHHKAFHRDSVSIRVGDVIRVRILSIEFKYDIFQCICILVE